MDSIKHLPSDIAPTFSETLRIDTQAGSWIFISGQVGVPLPPEKGSITFEQEVRTTFEHACGAQRSNDLSSLIVSAAL